MPAPLPPDQDERAVVDVYRRAERALLDHAARQGAKVARDPDGLPRGVQAMRTAARTVVGQLDVITPGLFADGLRSATERGAQDAADVLRGLDGRAEVPRSTSGDPGANIGALDRLSVALLERTAEVHRAILRGTPDRYQRALVEALPAGLLGVETRREVTQRAVWQLADEGITTFVDRSGRTWRASTYMEMATRTALQRAQEDAKLDRLRAAGHDLVIVNGGRDRCSRCRPWNGLVLSITGATRGTVTVPDAIDGATMVDVVVAGTVADARAAGWGHPNCRCGLDLYQPGLTTVPAAVERTDNGQYAARQRQRALERDIRRHREREAAAIGKAELADAKRGTRAAQARIREHLAENPDLLRRSYREQIGAGNIADAATAERFRADRDTALPDAPAPTPVRKLKEAVVERRMNAALAREDMDAFDVYGGELDRRDEQRNARRARDQRKRDEREDAKARAMEELLEGGATELEALREVYGERAVRAEAVRRLKADGHGHHGTTFAQMSRAAFADYTAARYWRAEEATNGYLLTKKAEAAGVDPRDLFVGPISKVRKHASPELREWFDQEGRPTLEEYRAELLGDVSQAAQMRAGREDLHR